MMQPIIIQPSNYSMFCKFLQFLLCMLIHGIKRCGVLPSELFCNRMKAEAFYLFLIMIQSLCCTVVDNLTSISIFLIQHFKGNFGKYICFLCCLTHVILEETRLLNNLPIENLNQKPGGVYEDEIQLKMFSLQVIFLK